MSILLKTFLFKDPLIIFSPKGISLALFVLLLAGCSFKAVEIQQEKASRLAGELLDDRSFRQTFALQHDGLNRIDHSTATSTRENTQPVIFWISSTPGGGEGEDLYRRDLLTDQISNSGLTAITFSRLVSIPRSN